MKCVPYARERSGIAYLWRCRTPGGPRRPANTRAARRRILGSVLVLTGYAGPDRAHLAVVSAMVSAREIRVDHANWLNDGAIYHRRSRGRCEPEQRLERCGSGTPRTRAWGTELYLVEGFIGPGPAGDDRAGRAELDRSPILFNRI